MHSSRKSAFFEHREMKKLEFTDYIPLPKTSDVIPFDDTNANAVAQHLYCNGAALINSGKAYARELKKSTHQEITALLMTEYNNLPEYQAKNSRYTANNPFHALFVLRVALDHLEAEKIYLTFIKLKISYHNKRLYPVNMTFPNGSEMLGETATLQILRAYIMQHPDRFKFLSRSDRAAVDDKPDVFMRSYSHIAGSSKNSEEGWDIVDRILSENAYRRERSHHFACC